MGNCTRQAVAAVQHQTYTTERTEMPGSLRKGTGHPSLFQRHLWRSGIRPRSMTPVRDILPLLHHMLRVVL